MVQLLSGPPCMLIHIPCIGVRARGAERLQPPPHQTPAKPLFFGQKLNFSARSQQPKMKKNVFRPIKRKKRNSLCLARKSARNPGFLLIITEWGELGKVILQVSIAVFWGADEKFFGQRWLSPLPPRRKNWPVRLWYRALCNDVRCAVVRSYVIHYLYHPANDIFYTSTHHCIVTSSKCSPNAVTFDQGTLQL